MGNCNLAELTTDECIETHGGSTCTDIVVGVGAYLGTILTGGHPAGGLAGTILGSILGEGICTGGGGTGALPTYEEEMNMD